MKAHVFTLGLNTLERHGVWSMSEKEYEMFIAQRYEGLRQQIELLRIHPSSIDGLEEEEVVELSELLEAELDEAYEVMRTKEGALADIRASCEAHHSGETLEYNPLGWMLVLRSFSPHAHLFEDIFAQYEPRQVYSRMRAMLGSEKSTEQNI